MTQEEKQLPIIDLCARLPYGVKVQIKSTYTDDEYITVFNSDLICLISVKSVKPYLRPMSSMTKEEFQELHNICPHSTFNKTNDFGWIIGIDGSKYGRISRIDEISKLLDWLNKNMFDFRGLIPMGLALEATEGMYKV